MASCVSSACRVGSGLLCTIRPRLGAAISTTAKSAVQSSSSSSNCAAGNTRAGQTALLQTDSTATDSTATDSTATDSTATDSTATDSTARNAQQATQGLVRQHCCDCAAGNTTGLARQPCCNRRYCCRCAAGNTWVGQTALLRLCSRQHHRTSQATLLQQTVLPHCAAGNTTRLA